MHTRTFFVKGFGVPIVFLCFSTQLVVSRRFHLTIYRVFHEESESELKNDQILHPEEKIMKNRPHKIMKKNEAFLLFSVYRR